MKLLCFKNIIKFFLILLIILLVIFIMINVFVRKSTKKYIITEDDAKYLNADCILVLGAGIWNDKPSHMLEDRLLEGINLYYNETSNKLLMSGDHGKVEYDEVNIMKNFAIAKGIPSKDIFMDHAGFSTYESMYRAKEIFKAKKIVVVTQKYHLYRALYIANKLGLEAYGVSSDPREYRGQIIRDIREKIACFKDFFKVIIKPKPKYLGDEYLITGDGDTTNDK